MRRQNALRPRGGQAQIAALNPCGKALQPRRGFVDFGGKVTPGDAKAGRKIGAQVKPGPLPPLDPDTRSRHRFRALVRVKAGAAVGNGHGRASCRIVANFA
jgi:hypothetical protein